MSVNIIKDFYGNREKLNTDSQQEDRMESAELTSTECKMINLIARGKSVSELARTFDLSEHTIIVYQEVICRKMRVNNITQATIEAVRRGLVDV